MKPRKPRRFVPAPGGVTFQYIELVKYVDHMPMPTNTTRLKLGPSGKLEPVDKLEPVQQLEPPDAQK